MAQTVKNPPAIQETWVPSLYWEDSLEAGMATHSSILAWRIPCPSRGSWDLWLSLEAFSGDFSTRLSHRAVPHATVV